MRATDVWKHASDAEFDNAMEGMEKLVMNRLYELFVHANHVHALPLTRVAFSATAPLLLKWSAPYLHGL